MKITLSESKLNFIERLGVLSEDDGQPRIMGRIWGLLMVMPTPVTAANIAELLQISRGSVSTNMKLLTIMNVVSKSTQPGEREAFYSIAEQPYSALIKGYAERMSANSKTVKDSLEGIENPVVRERISNLGEFYRQTAEANTALLDKLQ